MSQDQQTYHRGAQSALIGLWVQVVLAAIMGALGLYAKSGAIGAAAWYFAGGLPVWGVLWVIYHQHRLERAEALEHEQLARTDAQADALFGQDASDLRPARGRLEWLYRWGLGTVSLVNGAYLLVAGGLLWASCQASTAHRHGAGQTVAQGVNTAALTAVIAAVAFVAFVVARYESGMTKNGHYRLLRGGAGYLMGNCLSAVLLLVGALFAHYQNDGVMGRLGFVISGVMMLVGSEVLLSWVLGSYRPRRAGQEFRPAFDSRVVGWMTSPGSIAEALSEAVNYQFGFEVSRSWFYQLLGRAVAPLVIFGLLTLALLSGLVIVAPYQEAIVTRFGRIGNGPPLGPGLHFKWPWPIARVQKFDVGRVHQVLVGSVSESLDPAKAILWVNRHADEEEYLLTARMPLVQRQNKSNPKAIGHGVVGMSLVGAQIAIQYRISDLRQYVTAAVDSAAMLAAMAQQRTNAYFLTQDIDTLLGAGRVEAGRALRGQIQTDVDAMGLGVNVLFAGLISVHPPSEQGVAAAFLEQIGALQERQSLIEQAQKTAIQALASVAGSPDRALQIDSAIMGLENALDSVEQEVTLEQLLAGARGQAAKIIYQARAERWRRAVVERAAAQRFAAELEAYRNAPNYFRAKRYLDALARGLAGARKFVLATGHTQLPVFRIDLKDAGSTIDTILRHDE